MPPARPAVRVLTNLLLLALPALVLGPSAVFVNAEPQHCFAETGQCVTGRFYDFWIENGGLEVFGYPLSAASQERSVEHGKLLLTQWFERARFELHPENPPPYDVLLGRLGNERMLQQGINWRRLPEGDPRSPHYVQETGHAIGAPFVDYYFAHGLELGAPGVDERESRALFGLPLSEPRFETNPNGHTVITQWFERARFEYHPVETGLLPPEMVGAGTVLLGLVGQEVRASAGASTVAPLPAALQGVVVSLEEIASGLEQPLFVTHAGDGSGRLFVVEKGGLIRVLPRGDVFLDVSERVSHGNEQGLLGLAFHPRFRDNGFLYVHYTNRAGDTTVSRFTAGVDHGVGDPGSEKVLVQQPRPTANHNGGMLAFGPDGYLYIAIGDGGGVDDEFRNGQNRQSLHGKLLRIDVDSGDPYGIPTNNPFVGVEGVRPEIWAYGLRNPWRFSFDHATGDLFVADVGQDRYEGLHWHSREQPAGKNFGWPVLEGAHCLKEEVCDLTGFATPIVEYDHRLGCSIVGGYVYRGHQYPELHGAYIFGDFCSGRIWALVRDSDGAWIMSEMLETDALISSFGEDETGELYVTDLGRGRVFKLVLEHR